jgi:peptidoglycan-N-acetylmuramic acid deacetylase
LPRRSPGTASRRPSSWPGRDQTRGDHALDASWAPYWRARVAEGHAFGSHTWRHGSFRSDSGERVRYRLPDGGSETLDAAAVCEELKRPDSRFQELTGHRLDPLWRAPGGRTTPNTLAAAQACGYQHVGWAPAGFLGDELPSDSYPNALLVQRALDRLKDGDIVMAHLGIWSRKDPFAPMLDPLISWPQEQGLLFFHPSAAAMSNALLEAFVACRDWLLAPAGARHC